MTEPQIQEPIASLNAKIAATALRAELAKHFVPATIFESFKNSLREHVETLAASSINAAREEIGKILSQHMEQTERAVGSLLLKHLETLRAEHPSIATVLEQIALGVPITSDPAPEPEPTHELELETLPENAAPTYEPPKMLWPPPLDGEFPTPAAFAALGFYPETYAHQLAEWEARKAAASAPVEPSTPAEETPATGTTAENGPSESATGASPETR